MYAFAKRIAPLSLFTMISSNAAAPSRSLPSFLRYCKHNAMNLTLPSSVHVIIGNEASDADSIISSICLAYLKSETCKEADKIYLPILPIRRPDIDYRQETTMLLVRSGIKIDDLIFSGDLDLSEVKDRCALSLTLTDHNVAWDSSLDLAVVEIIDHHSDQGQHRQVQASFRDIAFADGKAKVGSTCTLVAERFLQAAPQALTKDIALMLLGVIMIDTANLDAEAGRATRRDEEAVRVLEEICSDIDRFILFKDLNAAKFDSDFWKKLSSLECLRYDYKKFSDSKGHAFGIASMLTNIESFLSKDDAIHSMSETIKDDQIDVLGIMSFTLNPEMQRELLLFSPNHTDILHSISNYLSNKAEYLELKSKAFAAFQQNETSFLAFQQGNVKASRKQVAPVLLNFFQNKESNLY